MGSRQIMVNDPREATFTRRRVIEYQACGCLGRRVNIAEGVINVWRIEKRVVVFLIGTPFVAAPFIFKREAEAVGEIFRCSARFWSIGMDDGEVTFEIIPAADQFACHDVCE